MDRLRSMRVFARVAHLGSFASAGRELELSAASVTKLVAALERDLGARLLERTTRKVQLTEAGRFYLERCLEALHAIDEADAAMSEMSRAPRGLLRVTAPIDLGSDLARVVARFGRDYPDVTVDVRLTDHNVDLIEQGFDLGIGLPSPGHGSYVSRKLCAARVSVFAAPSYLAEHGTPVTPADLARHRHLVFVEPVPRTEWTFRKGNRSTRVELTPAALANTGHALVNMCVHGVGLMIAPSFVAHEYLATGRVVAVMRDYEVATLDLHVRYPSRRFLPAKVRRFLEALREHFGDDPGADVWWR